MKEQSNIGALVQAILSNSEADNWAEAKLEWKCVDVVLNKPSVCECGQHIHNQYIIENMLTYNVLVVGSTCVKKFENQSMTEFVTLQEKLARTKRTAKTREEKKARKREEIYQLLKKRQVERGIPVSARRAYIQKMFDRGVFNDFEFRFYSNIWALTKLTEKQFVLKDKLNSKILAYHSRKN